MLTFLAWACPSYTKEELKKSTRRRPNSGNGPSTAGAGEGQEGEEKGEKGTAGRGGRREGGEEGEKAEAAEQRQKRRACRVG